jgi:proliferating cell nuclear antigen
VGLWRLLDDLIALTAIIDSDRIAEYEMKLMDIDSENLGIPDTDYEASVSLPSSEFTRIVRDLAVLGESVRIEVSKEGVRFVSEGESANGNVLLKMTDGEVEADSDKEEEPKEEDDAEDEDEDNVKVKKEKKEKKPKVKKEADAEDVDMEDGDKEGSEKESEDEGEEEVDADEDSDNKKKRKRGSAKV